MDHHVARRVKARFINPRPPRPSPLSLEGGESFFKTPGPPPARATACGRVSAVAGPLRSGLVSRRLRGRALRGVHTACLVPSPHQRPQPPQPAAPPSHTHSSKPRARRSGPSRNRRATSPPRSGPATADTLGIESRGSGVPGVTSLASPLRACHEGCLPPSVTVLAIAIRNPLTSQRCLQDKAPHPTCSENRALLRRNLRARPSAPRKRRATRATGPTTAPGRSPNLLGSVCHAACPRGSGLSGLRCSGPHSGPLPPEPFPLCGPPRRSPDNPPRRVQPARHPAPASSAPDPGPGPRRGRAAAPPPSTSEGL